MRQDSPDLTWPLEPLEIAAGSVLEPPRRERPKRPPRHGPSARAALEELIRDALAEGRGSVSFSGGRDSSLVLAVACFVARREGLPDPVAITMRHRSAESREDEWQERVISHLKVTDWAKVDIDDSMDVFGEDATALLARVGIQSPPNAYLHLPVAKVAPEGTLLTGAGGDEILGTRAEERLANVLYRQARPRARDGLSAIRVLAPSAARSAWMRRQGFPHAPWLTSQALDQVVRRYYAHEARVRLRWDVMATDHARSRSVQLGNASLSAVGETYGCRVLSPLQAVPFVDSFAREVGPGGPSSRTAAMYSLAHDVLPDDVLRRTTKAAFSAMVFGPRYRAGVARWCPLGLPAAVRDLVDADRLREAWTAEEPHFRVAMLAQALWLANASSTTSDVDQ